MALYAPQPAACEKACPTFSRVNINTLTWDTPDAASVLLNGIQGISMLDRRGTVQVFAEPQFTAQASLSPRACGANGRSAHEAQRHGPAGPG